MVNRCRPYRDNPPNYAICREVRRRFKTTDFEKYGGLLGTALHFADQEYIDSLPAEDNKKWRYPRKVRGSFVRFLDRTEFEVSWYLEDIKHVRQVQSAITLANSTCVGVEGTTNCTGKTKNRYIADGLRNLWLTRVSRGGWGITPKFSIKAPELSPDQIIEKQEAICTEWSNLQIASALIAGIDGGTVITIGKKSHVEPYLILGAKTYWNQRLKLPDTRTVKPSVTDNIKLSEKSDLVVIANLNRIVSEPTLKPKGKIRRLEKLLSFTKTPVIRTLISTMMGDTASNADLNCEASRFYGSALAESEKNRSYISPEVPYSYVVTKSKCNGSSE